MKINIKNIFFITIFLFLIIFPSIAQTTSEKLSVNIFAELSVTDTVKSGQILSDYCESVGGYYTKKSDYGVSLRLPVKMKSKVEDILKKNGTLIKYNINSADIGNEYLVIQKQLESRKNLLEDYNKLIASSNFTSTLTLEKELMTLVGEMENLKGRINKMDNEYKFLKIDIKFFSEETRHPLSKHSSFDWINRINFYSFIGGYYAE